MAERVSRVGRVGMAVLILAGLLISLRGEGPESVPRFLLDQSGCRQAPGEPMAEGQLGEGLRSQDEGPKAIAVQQLGDIDANLVDQVVEVQGVLESVSRLSAGVKGTLDDGTGTTTLWLWREVYDGLADPSSFAPGLILRVVGVVSEYGGEFEIVPREPSDVQAVGQMELPSPERAIGQVDRGDLDQWVRVVGQIVKVSPFSQGVKATLDDGTGTIILLLWQELYDLLEGPTSLAPGGTVSVRGLVSEYRGELEIVPQTPSDVQVVRTQEVTVAAISPRVMAAERTQLGEDTVPPTASPAPTAAPTPSLLPSPSPTASCTPTPSPQARTIGSITHDDVAARIVISQARIAAVSYLSKGVKYTLTDGTGSIFLLMWQDLLEEFPDRFSLFPGNQLRVKGEIDEYEGDLEIIPRRGGDVVMLDRGGRDLIEERTVSAISPSDKGRIFIVEGTVTRVSGRTWLNLWLNDDTGEILIYVPQRVVEYLPAGIGAGVRLRVTGEVDLYKGTLEIIPLAGVDVEVR